MKSLRSQEFQWPAKVTQQIRSGVRIQVLLSVLAAEERQDVSKGNVKQSPLPSGSLEDA